MKRNHRREFLAQVGQGMLVASVGYEMALDLGLASAFGEDAVERLTFGSREPLVALMQETPPDKLLSALVAQIAKGTSLKELVATAALANARTFGGEDYIGFHSLMAIPPAYSMAMELPAEKQALPILKVLYRNTKRMQAFGGKANEVLRPVEPLSSSEGTITTESLREAVHARDLKRAEAVFTAIGPNDPEHAWNALLPTVQDNADVHRVVLAYRSWDLLGFIGREEAHTMLRQSLRYCVGNEKGTVGGGEARNLLPKLLEAHRLTEAVQRTRSADDEWIASFSDGLFRASPESAAALTAAALEDRIDPQDVAEAISIAANQLVLRDAGRTERQVRPDKPLGSVHGDSIGVHGCDSANAWRNIALVSQPRNSAASLIMAAYHMARDRAYLGEAAVHREPWPTQAYRENVTETTREDLLGALSEAIRGNDQHRACAVADRYVSFGHPEKPIFDLLLGYACSEEGALHGEKYYRTARDEYANTRAPFRGRQIVALARVTASAHGQPAEGYAQARELLGLS